MLLLGTRFTQLPIMGLQTGTRLAVAQRPLIDPRNLAVIAYEATGPLLDQQPSFIRVADIRELAPQGFIIDSSDEFIGLDDVIKVRELYELNFQLTGLRVIDEKRTRLGKVEDFILDTDSFIVQQLTVRRTGLKALMDTTKTIHRSQIVEINNTHIVVKSGEHKTHAPVTQTLRSYSNPFRKEQTPQPEATQAR